MSLQLTAQVPGSQQDSLTKVRVLKADYILLTKDDGGTQFLKGDVVFYHDSSFLYCDSARLVNNHVIAMGEVVLLRDDTTRLFGDSLRYNGDSSFAEVFGEVLMEIGQRTLQTQKLTYDMRREVVRYYGKSVLEEDRGKIYSRRGTYRKQSEVFELADSVYIDGDSLQLYSDTLKYLTRTERVLFEAPTTMNLEAGDVYCEDGYFDYKKGFASFQKNARFDNEDTRARADTIEYDTRLDSINLIGNASYVSSDMEAEGAIIAFNRRTGEGSISGFGYMKTETQEIQGEKLSFNTETEVFSSKERIKFESIDFSLDADEMFFASNSTELGYAFGNVIYRDTINDRSIFSDTIYFRESDNYFLAYGGRPIIALEVGPEDTLYICADTLSSYQMLDSTQQLVAHYDVRILGSDLQGICDSLSFNDRDSLMQLWENPVLWLDSTQLTADSMQLRLKDGKADLLEMRKNCLIISLEADPYYQQIKGKSIDGRFRENALDIVDVDGNAESIYYIRNDAQEFIGLNRSVSSKIQIDFDKNTVKEIRWLRQPTLKYHPMAKYNHRGDRLEGFVWRILDRPIEVFDLK